MAVEKVIPPITALADMTGFTVFGFSPPIGVPLATTPGINDAGATAFWNATRSRKAGIELTGFDAGDSVVSLGKQEITTAENQRLSSTVINPDSFNHFLNQGLNNREPVSFLTKLTDDLSNIFRVNGDNRFQFPLSRETFSFNIKRFTTTIAPDGDQADIYYPQLPRFLRNTVELPIALMLQGALVDKSDYSNFASQVASYGFVVVVPNNRRTLIGPGGQPFTGLFPEQEQVNQVLAQMRVEDRNPSSPIFKIVDTDKLGLLGHSFGGGAGLGATQEEFCLPGICSGNYTRPPELKAGIFYGTNFRDQLTGRFLPIANDNIPIGLIEGSLDSVALPAASRATYDQILNPPKALITVAGANHYGITNEDNPLREPNRPTIDQATATATIARWSGLFLRASMLGNQQVFDGLFRVGDALDPNVSIISQTRPALMVV